MQTLPLPRLAALLRDKAKGHHGTEAATELLIGHGTWLQRSDFVAICVDTWERGEYFGPPIWPDATDPDDIDATPITEAALDWEGILAFASTAPCSGSEGRILRLAAELAGTDTGPPLAELLSGLDDRNSALVLDAVAQALNTQLWAGGEDLR